MKIGIIADSIREKPTGIGKYSENLIENLLKVDKKNKYSLLDYEENEFNKKNLCLIRNYFLRIPVKTYTWYNVLPFQIKNFDFDFIFNISGTPHVFRFFQKEILWVYDLSVILFPQFHTWWRVLINKFLFKRSLHNAYKIVVISESTKKDLIRYYKISDEKIIIIYPQISTFKNKKVKPEMVPENPYLLYLGTLEPRKNIPFLIKAFKKVKDDLEVPHKLIIAGKKGWGFKEIFDTVHKFDLEKEVVFTGYVSEAEKKYLYKHADLFIYPSLYEGFGIPLLEAMNYGCPVITSNTSSLPEVAGKAGILINPNNLNELVNSIKKVLTDEKIKDKMINESFLQTKKFSGKKSAKKIMQLIDGEPFV